MRALGADMWSAEGTDPVTGDRDEGVAVRGVPESVVLELGVRYGQDAVFVWTPAEWAIVACTGGRRVASGWQLLPMTLPGQCRRVPGRWAAPAAAADLVTPVAPRSSRLETGVQ